MFEVEAVGEAPLWISRSVFLWKAIFKLSINQSQTLMYTPLCPWVFVALLCGPYFPSQTCVVSYSLHPLPLIGQRELLAGPFLQPKVGAPVSINGYLPYPAVPPIVALDVPLSVTVFHKKRWELIDAPELTRTMKKATFVVCQL